MPTIHITSDRRADHRFQDGALPHATGVKHFQVLRANRNDPGTADGIGWTYNHAPMLAYAYGYYFCEYLSNPVDEHEVPGHTMLSRSRDGISWEKPVIAFPEVWADTSPYLGPASPQLLPRMQTVPHQRMGFYMGPDDTLLILSFYGIVHDRHMSMPCDGWGIGRAVRRVFPDGSLGDIYFLMFNEPAGFNESNTHLFPLYTHSPDPVFIKACEALLQNGAAVRQMYEEQRFDKRYFPTPGAEALSFYTASDGKMVGVYKKSLVSLSSDGGKTWSVPERSPDIHTMSGKVWGEKTSDGRYALMYNPTFDGQHRWPIAVVTGDDGYAFSGLLSLTDDMSPQRYGGLDKNLGPQYLRGIAECNPRSEDGDVRLVYSNNKEDIWFCRVPVPIRSAVPLSGDLSLEKDFPPELGVYSPCWAPVRIVSGSLVMRDKDPYDRAMVNLTLPGTQSGKVSLLYTLSSLSLSGEICIQLTDDLGRVSFQLLCRPDGAVAMRMDGRIEPFSRWEKDAEQHLEISADMCRAMLHVTHNGTAKSIFFNADVSAISRLTIATKRWIPDLSTLDDCGKYGCASMVRKNCETPTDETCLTVRKICWNFKNPE